MSKLDSVSDALELYVDPFDEPEGWADVIARAAVEREPVRARPRRHLVAAALALAAVAALAVSPMGGAIVRGVGDFSSWLTGSPGEPASEQEQRAFERERSWASFPDGPQLRRLAATTTAGETFELFGFRTGDSLCLRLVVDGAAGAAGAPTTTGCAPLRELRDAAAPVLPIQLDYGFGQRGFGQRDVPPNEEGMIPARASASFGVVADGITGVEQRTASGVRQALVANNAFLAVTPNPPLGLRTKAITAVDSEGARLAVPLAAAPFGTQAPVARPGIAPGPTEVERHVENGTIGWLMQREPRGESAEEAGVDSRILRLYASGFVRVVTPDPADGRRVMLILADTSPFSGRPHQRQQKPGPWICVFALERDGGAGGGCSPAAAFFPRTPFSMGFSSGSGGDQYATVHGLASDDVTRMEMFLGNGERLAVPLADNAFIVEVARTKFPMRLVAYDADDRVIGIDTYAHDPMSDSGPRPIEGKQRLLKRITSAGGLTGTLRAGPSTGGGRCWRISFSNGAGGGGCPPKRYEERHVSLNVQTWNGETFAFGTLPTDAATVELRFANGGKRIVASLDGGVLEQLDDNAHLELAIAYDAAGRELARQRRPPP